MQIIHHRRNTREQLLQTNPKYGVEVDIRSLGDRLVIHHDPFADGEAFEPWIAAYRHGTLILNVKEEGLEDRLLSLMAAQRSSISRRLSQQSLCIRSAEDWEVPSANHIGIKVMNGNGSDRVTLADGDW